MINSTECSVKGCNSPTSPQHYNGILYCRAHYTEIFTGDFLSEYKAWLPRENPSKRLLVLMGRMLEEYWSVRRGMLTKARLRDRGFNFEKTSNGCTFEITRHPGAFKYGYVTNRVVQKWNVDITECCVSYLSEREWVTGDLD